MIPHVSRNALLAALTHFDRDLRCAAVWQDWERKPIHRYALCHEGRYYPVKQIVSLASGIPAASLGAPEEVNRYCEMQGFEIVRLTDVPPSAIALGSLRTPTL